MSVPELPYSIYDRPLDCLRKTTKLIEELRLDLNKLHERNKFIYNYMIEQLQIPSLTVNLRQCLIFSKESL